MGFMVGMLLGAALIILGMIKWNECLVEINQRQRTEAKRLPRSPHE